MSSPGQQHDSREERLRRYFRPIPEQPDYTRIYVILTIGGVALLLALGAVIVGGSSSGGGAGAGACCAVPFGIAGLVMLVVGGARYSSARSDYERRYNLAVPKMADEEVDAFLAEDLEYLSDQGLHRLNLTSSDVTNGRQPDAPSPMLKLIAAERGASGRVGDDGKARFTDYVVMFVYLSTWHMSVYICHLDFIRGRHGTEETKEYHYQDVVGVETVRVGAGLVGGLARAQQPMVTRPKPRTPLPPGAIPPSVLTFPDGTTLEITFQQVFRLLVNNGDKVEMVVRVEAENAVKFTVHDLSDPGNGRSEADQTIKEIQNQLRAKKGGLKTPDDHGTV